MKLVRSWLFLYLFLFPILVLGNESDLPSWARPLMHWETSNSYKPDTEVKPEFRPENKKVFGVKSFDIPVEDLHLVDSGDGGPDLRSQVLVEKNGKKYFRFFVHPESEHLYKGLMQKYGAQELYLGRATASTRGLFAWPKDPKDGNPLFLKLSLAKIQDQLGRIIPGWEVRRSIGISELASRTDHSTWMKSGASIIPEVMGAYVDKSANLPFYVDEKQGKVYEHGLIIRDASFLQEAEKNGWEARPLFSLFTPDGDKPPLIIQKWKESKNPNFVNFLEDYLFRPFIEKNSHLFFEEHIVPEIHGQNVVVAIDPKTKEIKHFYHRDVGSMKVDLRMRWIDGKDVEPLRTPNAAFDFKFERATSAIEDVYHHYLNDWLFRWTYQDELRKYVPGFRPEQSLAAIQRILREEAAKRFPLKAEPSTKLDVTSRLEKYIQENPPELKPLSGSFDEKKLDSFLETQKANKQFLDLPVTWQQAWNLKAGQKVVTVNGVVVGGTLNVPPRIYFHSSPDLREFSIPKAVVSQVAKSGKKRIGFFSGTFDPPHEGHKKLIERALNELDLDEIYLLPTPTPDHKPNATPYSVRRDMAKAFFQDPRMHVADDELAKVADTQGIGGLQRYLSTKFAKDDIFQIMGADALERIQANPAITFPKNFTVVVGEREGYSIKIPTKTSGGNPIVELSGVDDVPLSSTKIRKEIAEGKRPAGISEEVFSIIQKSKLYGIPATPDAFPQTNGATCWQWFRALSNLGYR